ncbi:hypothetical protein [Methylobacterium sp. SyP6R]|uniref:hypothetical protein n=1 Tax=Methylobacterium sp. SyP6R TaxID=2718876 RepID=UPI001F38D774|nr:hypothetical protein [Methylobacterium sp. SyP6R]MCF4129606.1 hypothetical protein [Methylobacterium sp. SyP6R]
MRLEVIDIPRQDIQNLFNSQPMGGQNQTFEPAGSFGPPSQADIAALFSGTPMGFGNGSFSPEPSNDPGNLPFNNQVFSNFLANLIDAGLGSSGSIGDKLRSFFFSGAAALYQSYDSGNFRETGTNFGYGSFYPSTVPGNNTFLPSDPGYGINDPGAFQGLEAYQGYGNQGG